jgi:hypothetical protein
MQAVTTIGLDIAKSVFQVHGVDAAGNVVVRRQLKRRYVLTFFVAHRRSATSCRARPLLGEERTPQSDHSIGRNVTECGHPRQSRPLCNAEQTSCAECSNGSFVPKTA